jgi:hypothetical protein
MICDKCNQEVNDTEKYCNNCGAELTNKVPSFSSEEMLKASVFSSTIDKILVNKNSNILEERKNQKRKKRLSLAIFMIVLGLSLMIAGLFMNQKSIFYSNKGKRTVMIYMIGSDLESKYLAATKDIDEMINSSINYNDINILLYTGGTKKWHNEKISSDKQGLFEINESGLELIEEYDPTNKMLDYDNLLFLLKYGYDNYDTEYYDLILWDHGAGPIYGYGYDEYNKLDSMSISNIKKALNDSPFMGENKLEMIGFDACLMSSVEIASTLSSYANYMVASQEFEPGSGWDYTFLEKVNKNTSTQELGKLIIDYYEKYYMSKDYAKGISLSLLKLNKIDNVIKYTNQLFSKIDENLVFDFSSISRTRSNSKSYGRIANEEYSYDLVDYSDLLNKLPVKYEEDVNNLKTSLSDLVIYQKTDLVDTNGVSIFFPYENKKEIQSSLDTYKELDFSSSYYDFVSDFSNKLVGNKISNWDITQNNIESYGEGNVSITLDEDIIKNYSKADYIIFEKTKNNSFIPIFNGSDIEIKDKSMTTTIQKKSLVVKDKEDNQMYLTAIEAVKGNDYVSYYIPATISKFDTDTLKIDIVGVYIDFVVDSEHPNGYISNVYPIDLNENLTYSKVKIDLKEWDDINFLSYKYKILDEGGNYTSTWQNDPEIINLSLSSKEEIDIKFSDLDISKEYYCLFRIKDSQNNSYLSRLVKVNKK